MYYSTDIFMSAGLTAETSQYATLGMGGMNVLMTVVSLAIIEKAGRKTLMLLGLAGMMFDVILLTICLALKVNSQNCLGCSILTDTDGGYVMEFRTRPRGWRILASSWSSSTWCFSPPVPAQFPGFSSRNSLILQLVPWLPLSPSPSTGLPISSSVLDSSPFRYFAFVHNANNI